MLKPVALVVAIVVVDVLLPGMAFAQCPPAIVTVANSHQKISNTQGGFTGGLTAFDSFGTSVAALGDVDNDGVTDVAVGVPLDDDGGASHGAVWILFLNANGTVKSDQKISSTQGGFAGVLDTFDNFGSSVAGLRDLDNDGVCELAVCAIGDDDGGLGSNSGAVWILFLNADGTVKKHQKISSTQGGFQGSPGRFGTSVAGVGDLDNNGVLDLAVGSSGSESVWILFLNANGTVKSHQEISATQGLFTGVLGFNDNFGSSLAALGDLDSDGVIDLAVGSAGDDEGGSNRGAVWILFLNANGTVKRHQKISSTQGNFAGILADMVGFGSSVAALGDLDGDGVPDLTVGAPHDDDGGVDSGAVWVLLLDSDGTVRRQDKIGATQGGFMGTLDKRDGFGHSVAALGDVDSDGLLDVLVGAPFDDDGGLDCGAAWLFELGPSGGWLDSYGQGCPGTGGFVPDLTAVASSCPPVAPGSFQMTLLGGHGGATMLFAFGIGRGISQVGAGSCSLLIGSRPSAILLGSLGGVGAGQGSTTLGTLIPPGASGAHITVQAWVLDGSGGIGAAASNGIDAVIE